MVWHCEPDWVKAVPCGPCFFRLVNLICQENPSESRNAMLLVFFYVLRRCLTSTVCRCRACRRVTLFITSWPRLPITQALGSFNRSAHRVQRCKRASSAQSVWLRTQKTETSRNGFIEWVRHQVQKERKDQFSAIFHQSPSGGGGPARFTCFLSSALSEGLTNHFRRSHSSYPHSDLPSPALWRWTRHLPRET